MRADAASEAASEAAHRNVAYGAADTLSTIGERVRWIHRRAAVAARVRPLRALLPGRDTPVASCTVVLLLISSVALQWGMPGDADLRQWASTNLVNLDRHPATALVASLFVNSGWLPFEVVVFAVGASVIERVAGHLRAAVIPLLGHVIATLVTEGAVRLAIWAHDTDRSAAWQLDVGISYAAMTAIAAAACTLPRRWRAGALAALAAWVLMPLAAHADMTRWGHALCVLIGVLAWHWVRHPVVMQRRTGLRVSWSGASLAGLAGVGLILLSVGGGWVARVPSTGRSSTGHTVVAAAAPVTSHRCRPLRSCTPVLGHGVGHRIHVRHPGAHPR